MARIPVITGFGGISGAGRSSFHHAYRRLVFDALGPAEQDSTYASLASLMNIGSSGGALSEHQKQFILDNTLIRRIGNQLFNVDEVAYNKRMPVNITDDNKVSFIVRARNLPEHVPANWAISPLDGNKVSVVINGDTEFLVPSVREATVKTASQLPSGFDPEALYQARNHPRGLQMAVYGASDAVFSVGVDWQQICRHVAPDQVSVYAGSCMGQLDQNGHGGMVGARFNDKRTTSKQCPFGLSEMPADFINAYVLGSVGNTGTSVGACASFLYNLRQAVSDIKSGIARVVVVGNSEAPINTDILDGYAAMGALATDKDLLALDAHLGLTTPDYRRAARPFSSNCGFTMAESSQYVVLMDDELAVELGASVYGAITDVYVNADGHKKSISSPGVGNYITVAKAAASIRALLGEDSLRQRSYVHAHGTSTPQNRVTESHILNETAKMFGIERWPVAAIKAYLGHSLAVSGGDQLMASLGFWSDGIIPGIKTIDHVASDVYDSNLMFSSEHLSIGSQAMDSVILNSKGFGGNNASATVIGPHIVNKMLTKKYGRQSISSYQQRNEAVVESAAAYDQAAIRGESKPLYKFDHNVMDASHIELSSDKIGVPGFNQQIELDMVSPYSDLLD